MFVSSLALLLAPLVLEAQAAPSLSLPLRNVYMGAASIYERFGNYDGGGAASIYE